MSRASRAVFVLIMALVATAIGVAVAHADASWEFAPRDDPGSRKSVVVEQPAVEQAPGGVDDPSWE